MRLGSRYREADWSNDMLPAIVNATSRFHGVDIRPEDVVVERVENFVEVTVIVEVGREFEG